jgi:PAS domain S-box-containing protein
MSTTEAELRAELSTVQDRLAGYEEALRAVRSGEVDALVLAAAPLDERVFTLSSADRAYRNFVEHMSDGAATVSTDGVVLYANQALAVLVGSSYGQIVGRPLLDLVSVDTRRRVSQMIGVGGPGGSFEAVLSSANGGAVPVLMGSSLSVMVGSENLTCLTFTDLTRERAAEAAVAHSAQHDALTGLPNRALLNDRIRHALERRVSDKNVLALLFCDLDGFKNINDAHGHRPATRPCGSSHADWPPRCGLRTLSRGSVATSSSSSARHSTT